MAPAKRPPLLLQVLTAMGGVEIHEAHIAGAKNEMVHGLAEGQSIWVNPAYSTVSTLLHEVLHTMYPKWSEAYVTNRETYLMNRLTEAEVLHLYGLYRERAKKQKATKRA